MDKRTEATLARRSSGAAGTHGDRRTKRLKTREAQERTAINEQRTNRS